MNNESRTKNSIKNLTFALGGQMLSLLMQFAVRTVFIHTLGKEYLGLNGLFSNILSFLSLAELGIGESITISLYKPIAEGDEEKIKILMRIFRKAYCTIGIIILCIGASLTPFLPFFIKEMPDIKHIQIIYLLNVLISAASYFYSYKSTFIIANQKNYIVTTNRYIINSLLALSRCMLLLIWHNYIAYLVLQILFLLIENISISSLANKYYPVLKEKTNKPLDKETKSNILNNISALIFSKLGSIVVYSTDNILLSKLFGLAAVGLYSNYSLLLNTVKGVFAQFFSAVIASVGNLRVLADEKKQMEIYNLIFFINFWLFAFATTAFAVLIQPFISLWAGNDYLMAPLTVIFLIINFYIVGMRRTNIMFCSAYGLLRYFKYAPVFEIIINLGASVLLAKIVGEAGIFIGTTISTVCICLWIEPFMLFKHGIKYSLKKYFIKYFAYMFITAGILAATYAAAYIIPVGGIAGFVLKMIIAASVPNIIMFLIFRKSYEFKALLNILKEFMKKKKR